jgi:hypothetical protein
MPNGLATISPLELGARTRLSLLSSGDESSSGRFLVLGAGLGWAVLLLVFMPVVGRTACYAGLDVTSIQCIGDGCCKVSRAIHLCRVSLAPHPLRQTS